MGKMTQEEYLKKRENFSKSSAPTEQIADAIKRLDESYLGTPSSIEKANQQMLESRPDISDIGED